MTITGSTPGSVISASTSNSMHNMSGRIETVTPLGRVPTMVQ